MKGLKTNKLDEFSHILTGYVGSPSFLEELAKSIQQLKQKNPETVYRKLTCGLMLNNWFKSLI